jgi:hypothetical protein
MDDDLLQLAALVSPGDEEWWPPLPAARDSTA